MSSTTKRRYRSRIPAIGSTSVIGVPSSQCWCIGQARTTSVKRSESRKLFNKRSAVDTNTVTDQVLLSPDSVSNEKLPSSVSTGPAFGGSDGPVKYRV